MKYKFQVRRYRRVLKKALITSRFILEERQGLIIRLENEVGKVGFGEIGPLEFFGTESMEDAVELCSKIDGEVDEEFIESIDLNKMCCRFAFESAREMLRDNTKIDREFEVSALINLNDTIKDWSGYRTFKCKIGKLDFEKEKEAFIKMQNRLPAGALLRLDANGALSRKSAQKWMKFLEDFDVQYLEQPLAKGEEKGMRELSGDYRTAIALDESVVNIEDFERVIGEWKGWIIIKPALIGDLSRFRKLREECELPIVYSSIFETGIGAEAALRIAASDKRNDYAVGFGTRAYFFEDGFNLYQENPVIRYVSNKKDLEGIWNLCEAL